MKQLKGGEEHALNEINPYKYEKTIKKFRVSFNRLCYASDYGYVYLWRRLKGRE